MFIVINAPMFVVVVDVDRSEEPAVGVDVCTSRAVTDWRLTYGEWRMSSVMVVICGMTESVVVGISGSEPYVSRAP